MLKINKNKIKKDNIRGPFLIDGNFIGLDLVTKKIVDIPEKAINKWYVEAFVSPYSKSMGRAKWYKIIVKK